MTTTLPHELLWANVLPACSEETLRDMYDSCRNSASFADEYFRECFIIPALERIPRDQLYSKYREFLHTVVVDMIYYASPSRLLIFLNSIEFPFLCALHPDETAEFWNAIMHRNNTEILDMFLLDCADCFDHAYAHAIDHARHDVIMHMINTHPPSLHHFLMMVFKDDRVLLIKLYDALKTNSGLRAVMFDDVSYACDDMPYDYANLTCRMMMAMSMQFEFKDKITHKMKKHIRYFQKLVKYPHLLKRISYYVNQQLLD